MEEGRIVDFREHLRSNLLLKDDRILEFGPLTRPIVTKLTHPGIRFADIRSTQDIKNVYKSNSYLESTGVSVDIDSIVDIDYVIKGSYKESFSGVEKFDVVILSHVIEHMPDILFFFKDVMNLLKADGKLIIIYPDARYCFDRFRNGTTFIDAYDAHIDGSSSSKRVFDFVFNVVHENNPAFFWGDKNQNKILPRNSFKESIKAYDLAKKNILPDDTHFWPFADHQLIKFLYDMDRAGYLELDIMDFYPTQRNTQECMLVLTPKKSDGVNFNNYIKLLNKTSPVIKDIVNTLHLQKNDEDIVLLQRKNEELRRELELVYSSKKWKYASSFADLKNRLKRSN